ncbi:RagB/SusD family nutrient uptake outer membrane protein [Mucilaginibacter conchicola]|uniref:RagB/SusD family nutrient uptake outer membrane protein n=1 Tax=Mucilaginibacter conchicola TaxID=2303333 RepID=A0A372NMC7_9SPHI|nr:RagB/SusD family nutrient uptake outer membrane protein [Mucilaginibacter conchicola]RFZ90109.1 RagB/SusD family nutrient uptake outer membrane protein [Mucilaginibacter conchicola]
MKKMTRYFAVLLLMTGGCTKDYLDKRSDQSLLVPGTVADYQKLMDASVAGNLNTVPGLNEIASDNYTADDATLTGLDAIERNSYLWAKDVYQGAAVNDWNQPYSGIFTCNVVLAGIDQADPSKGSLAKAVKGAAYFHRATAFYSLLQEFAAPYSAATAASLPGLPVRTTPDVNVIAGRGTLEQSYQQVISDLKAAADLLPETGTIKNRPVKAAAFAMLARTYQSMSDHARALDYATKALALNHQLIDYNTLEASGYDSPFPLIFPNGNPEALVFGNLVGYSFFIEPGVFADPILYGSYAEDDLRKSLFFADQGYGGFSYLGTYTGDFSSLFGGPATDELYLIRAESYARAGNTTAALKDLNDLLVTRWKTGTFVPFKANTSEDALPVILEERRKELIGRGLRWTDLRRLNLEERFKTTISKLSNGETIELLPGDKRYVFPIPDEEVNRSGIPQNER